MIKPRQLRGPALIVWSEDSAGKDFPRKIIVFDSPDEAMSYVKQEKTERWSMTVAWDAREKPGDEGNR